MALSKRKKNRTATWRFRLYTCDHSSRSLLARANLERICETYLQGRYVLRISLSNGQIILRWLGLNAPEPKSDSWQVAET